MSEMGLAVGVIVIYLVKISLQILPYTFVCFCFICGTKVEVVQQTQSFPSFPHSTLQDSSVDSDAGGELCAGSDCIQQGNTSGHQLTASWSGCLCPSPAASPSLAPFLITWPLLLWSLLQLMTHQCDFFTVINLTTSLPQLELGSLTKARKRWVTRYCWELKPCVLHFKHSC